MNTNTNSATAVWPEGKTVSLKDFDVSLSQPVLVARSKGYLWFPSLARLANGDLRAMMSNYADIHTSDSSSLNAFSSDGGRTWSQPIVAPYGEVNLRLPSGDELFLPYYLAPAGDGISASYSTIPNGTREIKVAEAKVTITGWPRPVGRVVQDGVEMNLSAFVFNGQAVELKTGGYLATLYGYFQGKSHEKGDRMNLVAAESPDGVNWKIRSVIADENCKLPGYEGPCESALCRLLDGRLMCVFRMALQDVPLGQTWSSDEGKTWSDPVAIENAYGVQPSLAVMQDGAVVLSAGRKGIYLWFNADGQGKEGERIDLQAHHNQLVPDEPIVQAGFNDWAGDSSCYTEVVALDDTHLLVIYDRLANGWKPIPPDSQETNSVWVVQVKLKKKR